MEEEKSVELTEVRRNFKKSLNNPHIFFDFILLYPSITFIDRIIDFFMWFVAVYVVHIFCKLY
jgi:hypothetical protein